MNGMVTICDAVEMTVFARNRSRPRAVAGSMDAKTPAASVRNSWLKPPSPSGTGSPSGNWMSISLSRLPADVGMLRVRSFDDLQMMTFVQDDDLLSWPD